MFPALAQHGRFRCMRFDLGLSEAEAQRYSSRGVHDSTLPRGVKLNVLRCARPARLRLAPV